MFNFLGAIGGLLPGYIEGREKAIQANWQDLNQYSDVQAKQLRNLFTEATFNPLVNMQYDEAARANYLAQQDARANALGITLQPGRLRAAQIESGYMPALALQRNAMLLNYPQFAFGGMGDTLVGAMGYGDAMGQQQVRPAASAARGSGLNGPTINRIGR